MRSLKDTKMAALIGSRGTYIALSAALIATVGAGAAAYSKAVKTAEDSNDLTIGSPEPLDVSIADTLPADVKQEGVAKDKPEDSSQEDSSSEPPLEVKIQPNVMPVNGEILQPFSGGELVKSETLGIWKTHDGVDIAAERGAPVRAMNRGEVTAVEEDPLWGCTVIIDHGSGVMGYYYNLSSGVAVTVGDSVQAGQTIGAVGDTAEIEAAMASHLHFGLKKNGEWIDPIAFISPSAK